MNLIIDGDGLVFRCGFAVEKTKYLVQTPGIGPGAWDFKEFNYKREIPELHEEAVIWNRKVIEPEENALFLVKTVMEKLHATFPDSTKHIWLSPSVGNFREQLATIQKYKGNRDTQSRPKHFKAIRNYLVNNFGAVVTEGQEADDAVGIGATILDNSVIVSLDKDLDQIPGTHYNWVEERLYEIGKKEGTINFYSQVLSGDTSDNIPGLDGVGPATARKMLSGCNSSRDCWEVVLNSYQDQFGEDYKERALEVAQLCWVRRHEGEIWQPPGGEAAQAA